MTALFPHKTLWDPDGDVLPRTSPLPSWLCMHVVSCLQIFACTISPILFYSKHSEISSLPKASDDRIVTLKHQLTDSRKAVLELTQKSKDLDETRENMRFTIKHLRQELVEKNE